MFMTYLLVTCPLQRKSSVDWESANYCKLCSGGVCSCFYHVEELGLVPEICVWNLFCKTV